MAVGKGEWKGKISNFGKNIANGRPLNIWKWGIIALIPRTTKIDQKTAKKNHEGQQKRTKKEEEKI